MSRRYRTPAIVALLGAGLLAAVLLLSSCGNSGGTTTSAAPAPAGSDTTAGPATTTAPEVSTETIKIGHLDSITGPGAAAASSIVSGLELAVEEINAAGGINGRKLEVITVDDGSDMGKATAGATKLVEQDKVVAILGPFVPPFGMAVKQITEKAGVPNLQFISAMPAEMANPGTWSFNTIPTYDANADALLRIVRAHGFKKVAAVTDQVPVHVESLKLLKEEAAKEGIDVTILPDTWELSDPNMNMGPISNKIAASTKAADPEALLLQTTALQIGQVMKNLRTQGITIPIIGSPAAAHPVLFAQGPEQVEGLVIPGPGLLDAQALPADYPAKDVQMDYSASFAAKFGHPPDTMSGYGYDGLRLVAEALKTSGDDRAKLRGALESIKDFPGVLGSFTFSPTDHVGIHGGFAEWRVENGKFVFVRPLN